MYVTVRRYEGVSDPSEVARIVNERWLPIISEIPGFVDYYFVDAGEGVMVSTTIFEDPSGEEQSNLAGWRVRGTAYNSLDPKPAPHPAGEVVAHTPGETQNSRAR